MKKISIICLFFLLSLLTAACGRQRQGREKEETLEPGYIYLYYLKVDDDGFVKVPYKPEHIGDPVAASREILYQLSTTEESNTDQYKASVPGTIMVNTITMLDNNLMNIDFGEAYRQLSSVDEALLRASVVQSVLQLDGVDSVTFSVNGATLLGTSSVPVGPMDQTTFLVRGNQKDIYSYELELTLYYANARGDGLVPLKRMIETENNLSPETAALQALKYPPEGSGLKSPIPKEVQIRSTEIVDNICYVNLSPEIEEISPGITEKVKVYSMVDTLAAMNSAYQVQFIVDGEKKQNLNDFEGFGDLLSMEYELWK